MRGKIDCLGADEGVASRSSVDDFHFTCGHNADRIHGILPVDALATERDDKVGNT